MARATRPTLVALAVGAVLVAFGMGACTTTSTAYRPARSTTAPQASTTTAPGVTTTAAVRSCTRTGYSRAQFGNQPSTTVRKQLVAASTVNGLITDPYDGVAHTSATGLQADHVVPLGYAWDHGACAWTLTQRIGFAKDLTNLALVLGHYNESKGDSGPADWLPPIAQCAYVTRFMRTLAQYQLPASPADEATRATVCA